VCLGTGSLLFGAFAEMLAGLYLANFREGLRVGAGVLELDVHITADRVIVIHDDTVDRTTEGTGPVREMSFAEIRRLDAGYRFTHDEGDIPLPRRRERSLP
jgi:glycerophosphoryl diester phosphodiesterase